MGIFFFPFSASRLLNGFFYYSLRLLPFDKSLHPHANLPSLYPTSQLRGCTVCCAKAAVDELAPSGCATQAASDDWWLVSQ